MVGADLDRVGGALNLYGSPLALPSPLDPYLFRALWLATAEARAFDGPAYPERGVHAMPYSTGSDHDIALSLGIPASLVNEWPDRFYHTSADEPSNLSPLRLAAVASAVAAAAVWLGRAASSGRLADDVAAWARQFELRAYLDASAGLTPAADAARELVERGLAATAARLSELTGKRWRAGTAWERELKPARRGRISTRFLRRMGGEAGKALAALPEQRRALYTGLVALVMQATGSRRAAELEALVSRGERPDPKLVGYVEQLVRGR